MDPSGLLETTLEIPAACITNEPGKAIWDDILLWLAEIGLFNDYPEWRLKGFSYDPDEDVFNIDLRTDPRYDDDDVRVPMVTYSYEIVDSGTRSNGGFGPAVRVPVVFLPGPYGPNGEWVNIPRLTNRTLKQLIEPTLKAIYAAAGIINSLPQPMEYYIELWFMSSQWDSYFFWTNYPNWYYHENIYDRFAINYIVGGYAANQLGWNVSEAYAYVVISKAARLHFPWEPETWPTYSWFTRGYFLFTGWLE